MAVCCSVALLAEGVDRNIPAFPLFTVGNVALLAEGVDRNYFFGGKDESSQDVALLAEGVDRN